MQCTMDEKTIREKEVIALLRMNWPEFPKGNLIKTESPDFILKTSRKTSIGIEITRIDEPKAKSSKGLHSNYDLSGRPFIANSPAWITQEQIKSTIQRKEEKLELYQKIMADEYWLVITSGMIKGGIKNRISQNTAQWQFNTLFHKLFLLLLPEGKIIGFK